MDELIQNTNSIKAEKNRGVKYNNIGQMQSRLFKAPTNGQKYQI